MYFEKYCYWIMNVANQFQRFSWNLIKLLFNIYKIYCKMLTLRGKISTGNVKDEKKSIESET